MTTPRPFAEFERDAFRALNAVVEPLIRAGMGAPALSPFGAIVLEVPGRSSGETHRVPLLATVVGKYTIAATYRGERSQWVKNLQAAGGQISWWNAGTLRTGAAITFAPGQPWPDTDSLPDKMRFAAVTAWQPMVSAGWAIAILEERSN